MRIPQEKSDKIINLLTGVLSSINERTFQKTAVKIAALKKSLTDLPPNIKKDIDEFITQADIQKDYDLTHGISKKLEKLAEKIIQDLKRPG